MLCNGAALEAKMRVFSGSIDAANFPYLIEPSSSRSPNLRLVDSLVSCFDRREGMYLETIRREVLGLKCTIIANIEEINISDQRIIRRSKQPCQL